MVSLRFFANYKLYFSSLELGVVICGPFITTTPFRLCFLCICRWIRYIGQNRYIWTHSASSDNLFLLHTRLSSTQLPASNVQSAHPILEASQSDGLVIHDKTSFLASNIFFGGRYNASSACMPRMFPYTPFLRLMSAWFLRLMYNCSIWSCISSISIACDDWKN